MNMYCIADIRTTILKHFITNQAMVMTTNYASTIYIHCNYTLHDNSVLQIRMITNCTALSDGAKFTWEIFVIFHVCSL